MLLVAADLEIDTDVYELRRDGKIVPTEPLVFDFISFLAQNPGRLVSRNEIVEHVWDGRIVSDATVTGCLKQARQALGDTGKDQRIIRTVRARGFQFIADVEQVERHDAAGAAHKAMESETQTGESPSIAAVGGATAARSRPAVAVLPFTNMSDDPEQEYFADGLTEEIINTLAQFRDVLVAARNSTFRYKNKPADMRTIADELGVGFVLEGSVRKAGSTIRITAQLIERERGTHIYSGNYDRKLTATNLFEIQDDIAARVAAEIADPHGAISRRSSQAHRWRTDNLDAYECALAAMEYWRMPTESVHAVTRARLEKAVEFDPHYATAWAMLAILYGDEVRGGFNVRSETPPLERALEAASRAVKIDPLNAMGYYALFLTHFHRGAFDQFRWNADKALQLNPNSPDVLADAAILTALTGDWDRALTLVEKALRLSPDPPPRYHAVHVLNSYRLKDYSSALQAVRRISDPRWREMGIMLELMTLGQLGRSDEAKPIVDFLNANGPEMSQTSLLQRMEPWHFPKDLADQMIEGWRKAGLINSCEV